MAHFLEHLVFKGGEKFADYRAVNETAERIGGAAERLHEPRPRRFPHHRARRAGAGGDRPADGLRRAPAPRRRGARARARRRDPGDRARQRPAGDRRRAPDRPRRVRRASARAHRARARWSTCATRSRARGSSPSASGAGRARAAARSWSATSSTCLRTATAGRAVRPLPDAAGARSRTKPRRRCAPATLVEERDSNQSHLRMSYRPAIDPTDRAQRAALTIYATLLGGSMGSRLFDEIREQRGLAYSVYALSHNSARRADPAAVGRPRLDEVRRGVPPHARDRRRAARRGADARRRSSAPAHTPPARACSRSRTRTRSPATPPQQTILFGEEIDPDLAIAALDAVTYDDVAAVARDVADELAVACVGPHAVADFDY